VGFDQPCLKEREPARQRRFFAAIDSLVVAEEGVIAG
jgi:hypothetical protein